MSQPEGDPELPDDGLRDEMEDDDDDCRPQDLLRMPEENLPE